MKRVIPVVLAAMLSACGGANVCDGLYDAREHIRSTVGTCNLSVAPKFDVNGCNNGLEFCSEAELNNIEAVVLCVNRLPQCARGGEADYLARIDYCDAAGGSISAQCFVSVFGPQ